MSTLREAPETPPEVKTEAEKVAYCAGWWAALETVRKEQPEQEQAPACWVTVFGLAALRNGRSASVRVYAENGGSDVPLYTKEQR